MTKMLNVLVCLCVVVYMLVRFRHGAGALDVDIPSDYFRDSMNYYSVSMHEMCHFALWLLCFECLALFSSRFYDRYMKERFSFAKRICSMLSNLRFLADIVCIVVSLVIIVFAYLLSHDRKSFELVDKNGNSKVLVRDLESEQE